jgi:hypothetical protein
MKKLLQLQPINDVSLECVPTQLKTMWRHFLRAFHSFTLYFSKFATTILASRTESEIVATTFGDCVIGSPRNRIAATIDAATTTAPSIFPFGTCFRWHKGLRLETPRTISFPE